jgi:uncharacterized protein (TIGR02001 family)
MNVFLCAFLVLAALGTSVARAEGIGLLFPQITIASDYQFFGLSNSNREPALQASLYLWRPDNFYAGVWATEVDFLLPGGPTFEIDVYGGKHFDVGDTRLTVEAMYTSFPDQSHKGPKFNFFQTSLEVQHKFDAVTVRGEAAWTPDSSFGNGKAWRAEGGLSYAPETWLELSGTFGGWTSERGQDRKYWDFGVTTKWKDLEFDVRYVDTDLSRSECFFTDWCEPSVVGKITYNIPILGWKTLRGG